MKIKNQTGLKNFKPKIKLNHNIYICRLVQELNSSHISGKGVLHKKKLIVTLVACVLMIFNCITCVES